MPEQKLINNSELSLEQIEALPFVGLEISQWRGRVVRLYECRDKAWVYSVGETFDKSSVIIAREFKSYFGPAIGNWARNRSAYVSQ